MTDFRVQQGSTFSQIVRWETSPVVYKPITGISKAAPAIVTCVGHGVVDGWDVAVVSAGGMKQINCTKFDRETGVALATTKATVRTADSIELNAINSAEFTAYTSGGYLQYNTPVDLDGYLARMQVKAKLADTTNLIELDSDLVGGIALDNIAKTITITLTAAQTTLLNFKSAVYSLEMVSPSGIVTEIVAGKITLDKEITR